MINSKPGIVRKAGFVCLMTVVLFLFSGCKCDCTEEFFIQTITVLDENGSVVADAQVTPFNPSTLTPLNIDSSQYALPDGIYVVMTDDYVSSMEEDDLILAVAVEKEGYESVLVYLTFGTDFCACHIELREGDTLIQLNRSS